MVNQIDDLDRFYVSRKERRLANVEDCTDATIQKLKEYTKKKIVAAISTEIT